MTKNELMIGDWIMCYATPSRVRAILIDDEGVILDFDNEPIGINDIQPLPLTDDILTKNGFIHNTSFGDYYLRNLCNGCFDVRVSIKYNTIEIVKIDGVGTDCEEVFYASEIYIEHPMYVHDLQHFLRMHNLDDFADSLIV